MTEAQITECEAAAENARQIAEVLTERRDQVQEVTASSEASSQFRAELAGSIEDVADLAAAFTDAAAAMRRYLEPPSHGGSATLGRQAPTSQSVSYSVDDVDRIERHLARLDHSAANDAMISRIRSAMSVGRTLTEGERNFMTHELTESRLMDEGMPYDDAHEHALRTHPLMKNYDPEVVDQYPMLFNTNWRRAWGMEPR